MNDALVARIALPVPLRRCFDYLVPINQTIQPGMRVKVSFQSRNMIGMVVELTQESSVPRKKLKAIQEVLDTSPTLPFDVFQLALWAADYYHYPIGEVLWSALPTALRRMKLPSFRAVSVGAPPTPTPGETPELNPAQQQAVSAILTAPQTFQVFLLDGITGSGKTEVYLQVIEQVLQRDQQVLVLVPEISLTPQTLQRFRQRFAVPIVAWHSNLSERERYEAWLAAREGMAKIVIGTRSAVFMPLMQLGLIVVDEEHDSSFKQQERFRYHARDLAVIRAKAKHIPVILGSATPSLETLYNAQRGRYCHLHLPHRAGSAEVPPFQLIDVRRMRLDQGLSPPLIDAIRGHLQLGNQVMLFLNRRGYAPILLCGECGTVVECKRCDARLVYHHTAGRAMLHCHHCDSRKELPPYCEQCKSTELKPIGLGTQRLEKALQKHFPDTAIVRMDRDSTRRKGELQKLFAEIHTDGPRILLGTQMLAKGHHLPHVTLVGIIDADAGLLGADFRALERTGQLLLQVAGRAGRAEKRGVVYIQTHHPDHPLLQQLIHHGYTAFAETLLAERKEASLPPFSHFALFRAEANQGEEVEQFLREVKNLLPATEDIRLSGPVPALIAQRAGMYRMHLLVHAIQRLPVQSFLKTLLPQLEKLTSSQRIRWTLDVDPLEIF